ncbi:MAG: YihY/virulence factor BrkB family protein [Bacilli bacterium]|nr:YihY/virulence factor BrkB family protein [Bacilli bacterium]
MKKRINKIIDILSERDLGIVPGSLAYSFFLAIIPILSLLFYFLTTFHLPMDTLMIFLNKTFPESVVEFIQPVFTTDITTTSFITLWLSVIVMTNGCNAIIRASNTIYGFENAHILRRLIKSLILAIILVLLIAFLLIVPLFGRSIINLIGEFTSFIANNQQFIDTIYTILQIPVSLLFLFIIIKLIYFIAPDEKVSIKYVNKGAIFTSITWLIATILFSYYINHIARFDLVYGNLATIVVLLFYFYILAYVFVIGLFINRDNASKGIEKTNTIKLEEIRKKVKENK